METALQELMLNLLSDRVKTDIRLSTNLLGISHSVIYKRCWSGRKDVEEGKGEAGFEGTVDASTTSAYVNLDGANRYK